MIIVLTLTGLIYAAAAVSSFVDQSSYITDLKCDDPHQVW